MRTDQTSTSFAEKILGNASLMQGKIANAARQKFGSLATQPFANLLAENTANAQNLQAAKGGQAKATLSGQTTQRASSTKEFLSRKALQQSSAMPKGVGTSVPSGLDVQAASADITQQSIAQRKGIRVRSGKTKNGTTGQLPNRHNIGMEDTRKNRLRGRQSSPSMQGIASATQSANTLQRPALASSHGATPQASTLGAINAAVGQNSALGANAPMGQSLPPSLNFAQMNLDIAQDFGASNQSNLGLLAKLMKNPSASGASASFTKFISKHTALLQEKQEQAALSLRTAMHRAGTSSLQGTGLTGALSAHFESGSKGIAAIGYDRHGGTSYGKFQISSRAGTMNSFLGYLDTNAPELSQRLRKAGHANTGSRSGKMPEEWKKIAEEQPKLFESLQDDFIKSSHFEPAVQALAETKGVDFAKLPAALQEVLFSTAVQHGAQGASKIVGKALDLLGINLESIENKLAEQDPNKIVVQNAKKLVEHIYDLRANQFGSSTKRIQVAAKSRMHREKQEALQLLEA